MRISVQKPIEICDCPVLYAQAFAFHEIVFDLNPSFFPHLLQTYLNLIILTLNSHEVNLCFHIYILFLFLFFQGVFVILILSDNNIGFKSEKIFQSQFIELDWFSI